MSYLIWILTGIAVVLGFCLGVVLGIRRDLSRESIGTIIVGYTGEEDDGAHLLFFLTQFCTHYIPQGTGNAYGRVGTAHDTNHQWKCKFLYGGNSEFILQRRNQNGQ